MENEKNETNKKSKDDIQDDIEELLKYLNETIRHALDNIPLSRFYYNQSDINILVKAYMIAVCESIPHPSGNANRFGYTFCVYLRDVIGEIFQGKFRIVTEPWIRSENQVEFSKTWHHKIGRHIQERDSRGESWNVYQHMRLIEESDANHFSIFYDCLHSIFKHKAINSTMIPCWNLQSIRVAQLISMYIEIISDEKLFSKLNETRHFSKENGSKGLARTPIEYAYLFLTHYVDLNEKDLFYFDHDKNTKKLFYEFYYDLFYAILHPTEK